MAHPEYREQIEAYAEGQLPVREARELERHLQACSGCSAVLVAAQREVSLLKEVMAPGQVPADLLRDVMSRVGQSRRRPVTSSRLGIFAGVAANLITAAILLTLSLGTRTSLGAMLSIAIVGVLIFGTLKGLAFRSLLRFLPTRVLARGLVFGGAIWVITNALLLATGGLDTSTGFSATFVLTGSLLHDLLYGLLISLLYAGLSRPARLGPLPSSSLAMCLTLAVPLSATHVSSSAAAPSRATPTRTAAPTATAFVPSTSTASDPSPTPGTTSSAAPSPSPVTTIATTPVGTGTVTPAPPTTSPVKPTRVAPHPTRKITRTASETRPPREELRDVLPSVVDPPHERTFIGRVRHVIILFNFL